MKRVPRTTENIKSIDRKQDMFIPFTYKLRVIFDPETSSALPLDFVKRRLPPTLEWQPAL